MSMTIYESNFECSDDHVPLNRMPGGLAEVGADRMKDVADSRVPSSAPLLILQRHLCGLWGIVLCVAVVPVAGESGRRNEQIARWFARAAPPGCRWSLSDKSLAEPHRQDVSCLCRPDQRNQPSGRRAEQCSRGSPTGRDAS